MRACVCAVVTCLAVASLSTAASTPASAEPKDTVIEAARKRFQEGVKYFDQRNYEAARAAFLQAYALKHHPAVLLNLAQSEIRSGHSLDAAKHFAAFLRESANMSAAERADAEKGLESARTKIGRLQIQVDLAEADVFVDGERVGLSPLAEPVDVAPGIHQIEARYGSKSITSSATAPVGKITAVSLSLERPGPEAAGAAAPSVAGAEPVGSGSAHAAGSNAGAASASAAKSDQVAPPQRAPGEAPPPADEGRPSFFHWLTHSPLGLISAGVVIAGAGVGTAFYLEANAVHTKAQNNAAAIRADYAQFGHDPNIVPPNQQQLIDSGQQGICVSPASHYQKACQTLQDNVDTEKTNRTVSTVGFVAAGVGVASVIAGYFLSAPEGRSDHALLVPVYGPRDAGLVLAGSF